MTLLQTSAFVYNSDDYLFADTFLRVPFKEVWDGNIHIHKIQDQEISVKVFGFKWFSYGESNKPLNDEELQQLFNEILDTESDDLLEESNIKNGTVYQTNCFTELTEEYDDVQYIESAYKEVCIFYDFEYNSVFVAIAHKSYRGTDADFLPYDTVKVELYKLAK